MSRLDQYSALTLSSNTIIDTQNTYCLSSKVAVARSAKKTSEKVAALPSPFLSIKSSGATALNNPAYSRTVVRVPTRLL